MKKAKFTVLFEDSLDRSKKGLGLKAKHGLSILLETDRPKSTILVDTGQSSEILLHNMEALGVSLEKIDVILLSHGHYDHTGGLLELLKKVKENVHIIAHPDALKPKFKASPKLQRIGFPLTPSQIEAYKNRFVLAKNSVLIADGVLSTGEVDRTTSYEKPYGFWTVKDQMFVEDVMCDDQALVLSLEGRGLAVISGCAHAGVVNTIRQAQKLTGVDEVYAIAGGLHLKDSKKEVIDATIEDLVKVDPRIIFPCHCTGSEPISRLRKVFGGRVRRVKTGDVIEI